MCRIARSLVAITILATLPLIVTSDYFLRFLPQWKRVEILVTIKEWQDWVGGFFDFSKETPREDP